MTLEYPGRDETDGDSGPGDPRGLTKREVAVLALLAQGLKNKQIADRLVITLATTERHVHNILGKLGAATRTEAVARAGLFLRLATVDESPEEQLPEVEERDGPPFPGLRAFTIEDSDVYFGREEAVARALERLRGRGTATIVGASGSGKSSLLRAGVVAALRNGALPGSEGWDYIIMSPGADPLAELASRLAAIEHVSAVAILSDLEADERALDLAARFANDGRGNHRLVLVVDQLEELVTMRADSAGGGRFVTLLARAFASEPRIIVPILAVRADFYGELAALPGLAAIFEAGHTLLGPPSTAELRSAIEGPAGAAGLVVEPALVERVLSDLRDAPGALPLLSHALHETWRIRAGRTLALAGYLRSGGIHGAISQSAERVYAELAPAEQAACRLLMLRLATVTEGAEPARRRVPFRELPGPEESGVDLRQLARRFADARLLTMSGDAVEVAHEALLREWPRFRGWLDDSRESHRLLRHLTQSAEAWERGGRDHGELYRGGRLAGATEWAARDQPQLNATERAFLEASKRREDEGRSRDRLRLRRLRWMATGLGVLFVLATAAAGGALWQWSRAEEARERAEAATLEADAATLEATLARLESDIPVLIKKDRSLAFLLARQAYEIQPGPRTAQLLNLVLTDDPRFLGQFWASEPKLVGFDVSEAAGLYATKTQSGLVELWDLETRRLVASRKTAPGLTNAMVRFTPDGTKLLASGYRTGRVFGDPNLESESLILRVPSLELDREFLFPDGFAWPWGDPFTADSEQLALGIIGATPEAAGLYVLNLSDGAQKVHRPPENRPGATFLQNYARATFSPDGQMVAAGATCMSVGAGQRTDIFRVDTLEVVHSIPAAACWALEFSPDGRYLLLGIVDGGHRVALYDTTNWAMIARFIDPERNAGGATFTPDGKFIAAEFGAGAKLQLLAVPELEPIGAPFETLTKSAPATAFPAFFGTDSETLYSISPDGLVSHWTLGPFGLARRSLPGASEGVAAISPDGHRVAVQHGAGHWTIWDVQSGRILASSTDPGVPRAPDVPPVWSADGRYLVTGHRPASCGEGLEGRCPASVRLWDTETGTPVGQPTAVAYRTPTAYSLAIAVSGSLVAIGGSGWILQIYSIEPQGLVHQASAEVGFGILALSFVDAQTILVEDGSGSASTWDLTSNPPMMVKRQPYGIAALHRATAGPDGTLYIGASGALRSYDPAGFAQEGATTPLITIEGAVYGGKAQLGFSPDGNRIVLLRSDGTVAVYETTTGNPVGTHFGGPSTLSANLTPDGQTLVLGTDHGVEFWPLDPTRWAAAACKAAGRILTEGEWAEYFPGREFAPACG